uniref:Uncharacterized protein n=1 Tax=Salix viminalis TaxID=40686 RepID=A0A6N2NBN0_SALVM
MSTPLSLFLMPNNGSKQEPTQAMAISTKTAEPARRSSATNQSKRSTTRKCQTRKKQRQRGMGVAQLESLRIQERWKAITEANQNTWCFQSATHPAYGTTVNCGVPTSSSGGVFNGFLGWDHQGGVVAQRVDGFNVAVFEASKELSSIPKVMQQQQYEMGGFSARAARSTAPHANHNHNNNEVTSEVMTVHRKGKLQLQWEVVKLLVLTTYSDYSGYSASNASNSIDLSLKLSY